MRFVLSYDGPLAASKARPAQKHDVRRQLHPQLKDLWSREPLLAKHNSVESGGNAFHPIGDWKFASLVSQYLNLRAEIDVLMLRAEPPGSILVSGADIDNRLKTLFDALQVPNNSSEVPSDWEPTEDETPLHCLVQDDSQITSVSVRTDRYLAAPQPTWVRLVIGVRIWTPELSWGGMTFLGS